MPPPRITGQTGRDLSSAGARSGTCARGGGRPPPGKVGACRSGLNVDDLIGRQTRCLRRTGMIGLRCAHADSEVHDAEISDEAPRLLPDEGDLHWAAERKNTDAVFAGSNPQRAERLSGA